MKVDWSHSFGRLSFTLRPESPAEEFIVERLAGSGEPLVLVSSGSGSSRCFSATYGPKGRAGLVFKEDPAVAEDDQ